MGSCSSCTHPEISQGKKPTSSNNTPDTNNPPTPPNTPDTNNPPTPPNTPTSINEAIKQLEEEAQPLNPDPIKKRIYDLICLLPPHKFSTQPDGRRTRTSPEKNGHELFDKMLNALVGNWEKPEVIAEGITWLVDKKLLDLNEADEKGKTTLEKILDTWLDAESYLSPKLQQITDIFVKKGATISPEKAGSLLEKFLERLLAKNLDPKDYSDLIAFLTVQNPQLDPSKAQQQGATISPEKAGSLLEKFLVKFLAEDLDPKDYSDLIASLTAQNPQLDPTKAQQLEIQYFEKIINTKEYTKLKPTLDFLKTQASPLSPEQATDLLKKLGAANTDFTLSFETESSKKEISNTNLLYSELLDLGADPNIEVRYNSKGEKISLLEYAYSGNPTLFEKVVQDPKTTADTINKIHKDNVPLAIYIAYSYEHLSDKLKLLLNNPHLDINTLKSNQTGAADYTLLDIIVDNCINTTRKPIAEVENWLKFLQSSELVQHPHFFVTQENIDKATATLQRLIDAKPNKQSLKLAQKAVDFLKINKK